MTYTYAYKTSDGRRHEAAMDAESREAVFVALRARGIKAIKVVAADGSKANGEVRGKARGYAVAVVLASLMSLVSLVSLLHSGNPPDSEVASPRHQIYGDPAITEGFERGEFGDVLPREGDRLLAWFSQPGRVSCPKGTTLAELRRLDDRGSAALSAVAGTDVGIADSDSREVRELKQIVNGMRREMRDYLANGNGTPRSYWRRLNERTREEARIFERTRRELEKESDPSAWEERNAALRRLGLRTIPSPNEQ